MANLKVTTSFQEYSLPSSSRSGNYTSKWAQQDLEYLNEKLSKFSREPSQWDLYKITQVIENKDDYQAQINSLPPFSSAIINEKFINEQNESFNKGDLVYKNIDGTTTHITAERGGVFYPQKITRQSSDTGNTYDITFSYMTHEPVAGNPSTAIKNEAGNQWVVDTPSQQIVFNGLPITNPAGIYGHIYIKPDDGWSESFWFERYTKTVSDENNNQVEIDIFPIIKMYSSENEEIYCNYNIDKDTVEVEIVDTETLSTKNVWIIKNIPSIVNTVVVK